MIFRQRPKPEAEIPTASMADIAFLLIIFFMVSTTLLEEKGLSMVLPEPGEETKIRPENITHVLLDNAGRIKIDGVYYDLSSVREVIEDKLAAKPGTLIISFNIQPECRYGTMIDVFDELRLADARKISLVPPKGAK